MIMNSNDGDGGLMSIPLPSLRVEGLFMNQKLQPKPAPLSVRCLNTNGGLMSPQSPASNASARSIDPSLVCQSMFHVLFED